MARNDPLRNFRFRLEIDGITQAGFSEVAIAETTTEAVDYREGTDPPHVRKLSRPDQVRQHHAQVGHHRSAPMRSTSSSGTSDVSAGQIKRTRKKVAIVVQDEAGSRQGALRRHRGLADQVRPERPQRQGQRGDDRAARARQRRHRAGEVARSTHDA